MFAVAFNAIIRYVVIPVLAILFLQRTFVDPATATLIICIVLSVLILPMLVWHSLKLLPNIALLRKAHLLRNIAEIVFELGALVGFWMFYLSLVS